MVKVVDGGAGSAGRRSVAAWGMKAWPSRLKGRTNGSTCEGLDTQV